MRILFSELPESGDRPAIFLDRDGVINERIPGGYVTSWDQFRFIDGIVETVASLAGLGLPVIVISNQACVGKGLIDELRLESITRRFVAALQLAGGRVDAVYYCPHRPDESCGCRKPRPGLLEQASRDWRIDLGQSVLVGDSATDLDAAATVGCRAVLFDPAGEPAPGLAASVSRLLRGETRMPEHFLQQYKKDLLAAIDTLNFEQVSRVIGVLAKARDEGRRIFVCGNGGSASTASHFACDLLKGASFNRPKRFKITALTDSLPTLTAYSNDVCYDCVFVEQLKSLAEPGDTVMAISGSGNSPNVIRALEYGNSIGCRTIALTGRDGGKLGPLAELNIQVSNPHMGRIEDVHMTVLHMISYYFMETGDAGEAQGTPR
jgi:D-sedoheptulose 7-phosphate isomerase